MAKINIKRVIEKDENNKFHAVIKLGAYNTPDEAERMAKMIMLMLMDASKGDGIKVTERTREIIKIN